MAIENVVVLVGGVGGAKLAYGLAQILPPGKLTVIVNTGDDFWLYGLRICPDLDTITYTLSRLVDPVNGWGMAGDSAHMLEMMQRYGEETWFRLGDKDLATHLLRTCALHEGRTLTEVTGDLTRRLGIPHSVLPMTDTFVATYVETVEYGELDFQTYFVRYRWQPRVKALHLANIESASMTKAVSQAIASADTIIIGPSNPWLSIDPILSVPGMRAAIISRNVPRVAITPIIAGVAVKGPAAKLMAELGYESSAEAVARYYGEIITGFVYDETDAGLEFPNVSTIAMNTRMQAEADKVALARNVLRWIEA